VVQNRDHLLAVPKRKAINESNDWRFGSGSYCSQPFCTVAEESKGGGPSQKPSREDDKCWEQVQGSSRNARKGTKGGIGKEEDMLKKRLQCSEGQRR